MEKSAPTVSGDQLIQLATLLEQAVKLMREMGLGRKIEFQPDIPSLKRPRYIPKDQEWFWSDNWQAGERQVNEALARGEYQVFDSAEELIADLHQQV